VHLGTGLMVCRYAEMDPVEKTRISHRYRALSKLKEYLQQQD
jgi:inosine/xanthosine triphosphate pyrophosphatase family protein